MSNTNDNSNLVKSTITVYGIIAFILIGLWMFAGLAAFIMSLMCFGYDNEPGYVFVGLLLAIFTGPFYWFYYAFNKRYCVK
jgi:hypothetical protein